MASQVPTSRAHDLLKSSLAEGVRKGLLKANPAEHIRLEKADRPNSKEKEIPTLAELAQIARLMPERYEVAVWLLGACGLRMGEFIELRRKDFTLNRDTNLWTIRIDRQVQSPNGVITVTLLKGGKTRTTTAPLALTALITRHLASYAQTGATQKEIMERLGHSTSEAAEMYQHVAADRPLALLSTLSAAFEQALAEEHGIEYYI